jgi:aspartyl-tRNA(Asn)/glutamyl-tRNA(Gln) amidotransferase subunit A
MALAAIGSDTGGSVRIPSALCGLTGFKPTARRVPMQGVLPLSANLDSIGPLAPSVLLRRAGRGAVGPIAWRAARGLAAGPAPAGAHECGAGRHGQRRGRSLAACAVAAVRGRRADHREAVVPPFSELAQINAKGGFTAAEAWAWHRSHIDGAGRLGEYDPRVGTRILRGKDISAADLYRAAAPPAVDCPSGGADGRSRPDAHAHGARDRAQIAELQASDEAYFAANG